MKGKLYKSEQGWNVMYDQRTWQDPSAEDGQLPLHPDDVEQINRDAQVFDNIEARIASYSEVEFEIVKEYTDSHTNQIQTYAKLKQYSNE